ncbi:RagB/SusD family nutrient uptake outer membrane protein [Flavobacteriaceae bacterium]|nr:RagB/SusD family nutrient uptake outer membrane protein [Flavobacteriaceae bacterium]
MKNINSVLSGKYIIVSIILLISCEALLEDNFENTLEVTPKNQYSLEQVFSSKEGVETFINGMYAQLQSYGYYGARMRLLLWPHSGKYQSKQGANSDANSLNITNNNINSSNLWSQIYSTINLANIIIDNTVGSSLTNKNTSLGQAYFIRAVCYFDLVRIYNEVPLKLKTSTIADINVAKSSKEQLYNQIISDLELASDLLPDRGEYQDGRPLKYAANAYLAKLYITIAGNNDATINVADYNPVTETEIEVKTISDFWEEAKTELDFVINNGGYSLTTTFGEIFEHGNRNTNESIFELQYGYVGDIRTNDIIRDVIPAAHPSVSTGSNTFGRIRPNKEMFSDHIITYSGIDYTGQNFIPVATVTIDETVADPRISTTYIYNSYVRTNNNKTQKVFPELNKGNNAYPFLNKYPDPTYNNTTTFNNLILFRYADVLLLRAEVENEINGPNSSFAFVNQVLARARVTDSSTTTQPADWTIASAPTKEDFRERIMKEREYELNGEGHEWFDMRRRGLGRFQEQVNHHNNAVDFYSSEGNKDLKFSDISSEITIPIPISETSANLKISE